LRNDKRTLALIFIAPIFAMFVFGLAFSGDIRDVHVIVVNDDEGITTPIGNTAISVSDEIISNLDREALNIEYIDNVDEAVRRVEDGDAYAVVFFPRHFTKDLYARIENESFSGNTTIKVMADKSNINVANAITKSVNAAVFKAMEDLSREVLITVDSEDAIYGENAEFMDFFVPGVMAFVVYLLPCSH
jgi:ABC-2 type transport system permease protein